MNLPARALVLATIATGTFPEKNACFVDGAALIVGPMGRRDMFAHTSAAVTASILSSPSNPVTGSIAHASDEEVTATSPSPSDSQSIVGTIPDKKQAVVVLGAGGRTGRECVSALLKSGRQCVATTRTGEFEYDLQEEGVAKFAKKLSIAAADVTSADMLCKVIGQRGGSDGIGAVIFAASASASGGDANAVDKDGVLNVARCCIEAGIPRLVVVSSGAVTRPDSAVYQFLNVVGKGIMKAKIEGEGGLRTLYADPEVLRKGLGYTVIRPGGLTSEEPLGASALELNQGDDKSGRLSRADVASLCVNSLDSKDTFDVTFECYEAQTAKPLESVGLSNLFKSVDPTTYSSGREQRGETWTELFHGLTRDKGHMA